MSPVAYMSSGVSVHDRAIPDQLENLLSPANIFRVAGMVVVVTGGGSGIGAMIATALENNGATVYIIGRRLASLEQTARERNRYNKIIPLPGDVTSRDSLLAMAEVVRQRHGHVDLLVNNAGIVRNLYPHPLPANDACSSRSSIKAFQSALWNSGSPDDFADTFAINVTAVYYTTVAFLDLLHQGNVRQRKELPDKLAYRPPFCSSQVLSISSSGAFRTDPLILSMSYSVSKSACTHLGKLLANLLGPWGIRSNILAPGVFPSEMTNQCDGVTTLDPDSLASSVPLKRAGTQEDMTGAMLFLASRAGAYVNGSVFLVDGGRVQAMVSPI